MREYVQSTTFSRPAVSTRVRGQVTSNKHEKNHAAAASFELSALRPYIWNHDIGLAHAAFKAYIVYKPCASTWLRPADETME